MLRHSRVRRRQRRPSPVHSKLAFEGDMKRNWCNLRKFLSLSLEMVCWKWVFTADLHARPFFTWHSYRLSHRLHLYIFLVLLFWSCAIPIQFLMCCARVATINFRSIFSLNVSPLLQGASLLVSSHLRAISGKTYIGKWKIIIIEIERTVAGGAQNSWERWDHNHEWK